MAVKEIIHEIQKTLNDLVELEREYKGKKKGRRYQHKYVYLNNRIRFYSNKLEGIDQGQIELWQVWVENQENIILPYNVHYASFLKEDDIKFINKHVHNREILEIQHIKSISLGKLNPVS